MHDWTRTAYDLFPVCGENLRVSVTSAVRFSVGRPVGYRGRSLKNWKDRRMINREELHELIGGELSDVIDEVLALLAKAWEEGYITGDRCCWYPEGTIEDPLTNPYKEETGKVVVSTGT